MERHTSGRSAVLICILVAAALLTAAGCQTAQSADISGPWHNEQLNEVVRFHDDGTVVIRTAEGDFEANYVFDAKSANGVITLNETAISFTLTGNSLMLTKGGTQSEFTRGDMEVEAAAQTESPAETPTESPAETQAPTEEPTNAPTQTPTQAPTNTITPQQSSGPFPEFSFDPQPAISPKLTIAPKISGLIPGDIIGGITNTSIIGEWHWKENYECFLKFNADSTFSLHKGASSVSGTYTYDKTSKKGTIIDQHNASVNFTVSGNTLTTQGDIVFIR